MVGAASRSQILYVMHLHARKAQCYTASEWQALADIHNLT